MHETRQSAGTLPLNPSLRHKLAARGVSSTAQLLGKDAAQLAADSGLAPDEAAGILEAIHSVEVASQSVAGAESASAIFERELRSRKIITFCSELDAALGGGVATGQVAEFCGVPAAGKTQLGMQLAIDVQLPKAFGGLQGKTIYLDTEGSFVVERVEEMSIAFLKHLETLARVASKPQKVAAVEAMSVEGILQNIQLMRVHDQVEQLAAVQMLPEMLAAHPEVKLVVLDSVAFHFRQNVQDMGQRTRILAQMAQQLMEIASARDVAVVLMNQMTTKVTEDGSSKLVPSLGETWAHAATTRVLLHWEGNQRYANLYKSPSLPAATVEFFVTADGVRGRKPQKRPRTADARPESS